MTPGEGRRPEWTCRCGQIRILRFPRCPRLDSSSRCSAPRRSHSRRSSRRAGPRPTETPSGSGFLAPSWRLRSSAPSWGSRSGGARRFVVAAGLLAPVSAARRGGSARGRPGPVGTAARGAGARRARVRCGGRGPARRRPAVPAARLRRARCGRRPQPRAGGTRGRRAALPDGRRQPAPRRRSRPRARLRRGPLRRLSRRAARAALPCAREGRRDLLASRGRPVDPDPAGVGHRGIRRCHGVHGAPGRSPRARGAGVGERSDRQPEARRGGRLARGAHAAAHPLRRPGVHRGTGRPGALGRPAPRAAGGVRGARRRRRRLRRRGDVLAQRALRAARRRRRRPRALAAPARARAPRRARSVHRVRRGAAALPPGPLRLLGPAPRLRAESGVRALDARRGAAGPAAGPGVRAAGVRAGAGAGAPGIRAPVSARPGPGASRPLRPSPRSC